MKKVTRSPCMKCGWSTYHEILFDTKAVGDENYAFEEHHMIVECRGCGSKSFRHEYSDYEYAFQNDDGTWDVNNEVSIYPEKDDRKTAFRFEWSVPQEIIDIYNETIDAIARGNTILAGVGLRTIVESICSDKDIKGSTLVEKIESLISEGFISAKDAERLHALRFLGNGATHSAKKIPKQQIETARKIIDYALESIYVLDGEANRNLKEFVDDYEKFAKLLQETVEKMKTDVERPLSGFLGPAIKRFKGRIPQYERRLIADIEAGSIKFLKMGKIDIYEGAPNKMQHFKR